MITVLLIYAAGCGVTAYVTCNSVWDGMRLLTIFGWPVFLVIWIVALIGLIVFNGANTW